MHGGGRATAVVRPLGEPKIYAVGARANEIPLSLPDPHAVGRIEEPPLRKARRRLFRKLGVGSVPGLAPICPDSNDPFTIKCGFQKRLLRRIPDASEDRLKAFEKFVDNFLTRNVEPARQLTFEEWLSSTTYNEARKNELRAEYDGLKGGVPSSSQCKKVKSFVKTESYPEYKHCRLINSRSDAFKVFSGPLFKAVEERVYALPWFIKHVPVPERPLKLKGMIAAGRRYYSTDYTAYESHFTPRFMEACELRLYRHCLPWCLNVDLLCNTIRGENIMRTRAGVSAVVHGRRMSGDMCTSLGNGFSNLMLAMFLIEEKGGTFDGYVEGDDGIFATDVDLGESDFLPMGFTIKIIEVASPCEASFCGMVFSESGEIIREPVSFMATFGWTSSFINAGKKIMDELARAKALSTCYETPQCPIVGALARRVLLETRHANPRFVSDGYHKIPPSDAKIASYRPADDTRALFARLYGISIGTQLLVEKAFEGGNFDVLGLIPSGVVNPHYGHYHARYVEVG